MDWWSSIQKPYKLVDRDSSFKHKHITAMNYKVLAVTLAVLAQALAQGSVLLHYHERVGIPEAARIKQMEHALDSPGNRIVGGEPVAAGAYPFLVNLTSSHLYFCITIVKIEYLLTLFYVNGFDVFLFGASSGFNLIKGAYILFFKLRSL